MSKVNATPPSMLNKSYDLYKKELNVWSHLTSLEKKKQGLAVALSLPEDGVENIREKVFENVAIEDLQAEDGLKKLLKFMDDYLTIDDIADSWGKFEEFEDCQRKEGDSMNKFINDFDSKYNKIKVKGIVITPVILAFKLLRQAKLRSEERLLVLTGMNFAKQETLYEAKTSLKKFKGDCAMGIGAATVQLLKLSQLT